MAGEGEGRSAEPAGPAEVAEPAGPAEPAEPAGEADFDPRRLPPEILGFAYTLQSRRPWATRVLAGVIVANYALGASHGAPDLTPAVVRMGALVPDRVWDGEVWRLLSAAFLHGSLVHLAANTYVLWQLGTSLERLVGTARFLALYGLAAVGGSLLSLGFLDGLSVGASGAIWGLMCALFALSFRRGLLPEDFRRSVRSSLVQTLLINVMISLAPGIDWAAHAGGGLVGAGLAAAGLLTLGMPKWGEPARRPPLDRVPGFYGVAAAISTVVMGASVAAAVLTGRPWTLTASPTLGPAVAMGARGWTAELPAGLALETEDGEQRVYGDLRDDMGIVGVSITEAPEAAGPGARIPVLEGIQLELQGGAGGNTPVPGGVSLREIDGEPIIVAHYTPGRLVETRAFAVRDGAIVRVDVYRWPEASAAWDDVAGEVAASARVVTGR